MMPMIATTTRSSTSVNPRRLGMLPRIEFPGSVLKKRASDRAPWGVAFRMGPT